MTENPKVFISYSHDSPDHKRWVAELAAKLQLSGIDAILDQWDLGLGDDKAQFMQRGIVDADRVLVVCTENYVEKANAGEGGAGYEGMIINVELIQNLDTNKFIPIIRQASGKLKTPVFLGTKVYADFREKSQSDKEFAIEGQFDEEFSRLIHALYGKPFGQKPPLGENLFAKLPSGQEVPPFEQIEEQLTEIPQQIESASEVYVRAVELVRRGDAIGMRQLVKNIRPNVLNSLVEWRQNELDGQKPESKEQLVQVVDKAVEIISPLMTVALVGVESRKQEFNDQKSLFDELQNIPSWNPGGYEVWTRLPKALGYVYHSLHGCVCMSTSQIDLALDLARIKIPVAIKTGGTKFFHLWEMGEFRGYPISISGTRGGNSLESWDYLTNAYNRWEWLPSIFETEAEYLASLVAYYMTLNIHELATAIDVGRADNLKTSSEYWFQIPLTFLFQDYDITKRATSLLRRNPEVLMAIWTCLNVTREQIENSWDDWTNLVEKELSKLVFSKPYNPESLLNLSDIYRHLFEGM